jgi:hypothetical protein
VPLTPGRSCPARAPLEAVGCYAYASAHARIRRALGPASAYRCAFGCGDRAADWALCGELDGLPTEDRRGHPTPYSLDLARYRPLCRADHTRYDRARRRALRLGLPLPAAPPPPQHIPEPLFDLTEANAGPEPRRYWGRTLATEDPVTERDSPRRLAAARARAEAIAAERVVADRIAARTARVADVRARLALARAARADAEPPRPDPLAERAAAMRTEQTRAVRLAPWAADIARERQRLCVDALAAVTDHPASIDTEWTP